MLRLRTRGLHVRFLLVLLASASLFAAITGTLAYRLGYQHAQESGLQSIEDLISAVEKTAAVGAFAGDTVLMREVLDGLARNSLIASVSITDPTGRTLARSGAPATPTSTSTPASAPSANDARVERALASPFKGQQTLGRLVVYINQTELSAQGRRQARTLVLMLVLQVVLVAAVLYVAVAQFVSRPIVRLAQELRAKQPGTDARMSIPRRHAHDEIGVLIAGANALLHANAVTLERERGLRAEVERMEAQYRQIFDSTSAGIFLLNPQDQLVHGNPTLLKVMGTALTDVQQLQGQDFLAATFAEPEQVRHMIAHARNHRETVSADLPLLAQGGATRWVHCLISVQQSEGEPKATAQAPPRLVEGVMYDITDRKTAEHAVRHQAEHDVLTGLKNRLASEAALDRILAESAAGALSATLLFIDLDGFKQVNDTLGHAAGDEVLCLCAERMRRVARRSTDVLGRVGGDEFVMVLPHTGPADSLISLVAEGLLQSLSEPMMLADGRSARVGGSIGIACYPRHGHTRDELEESADQALYAVKRHGKMSYAMALPA